MKKPYVLCILDGWGHREATQGNAIATAHTPNWDRWVKTFPHCYLDASGNAVGLPGGQMGNSEVGHMAIGAGRVIYQDLPRIHQAIADGSFEQKPVLQHTINGVKEEGGAIHLMGLFSPGGVHSHQDHLFALCRILGVHKIPVKLHLFLDGRDTPPQSALGYFHQLKECIAPFPHITVATIGGRYYGMDRDNHWDRIQKAFHVIAHGEGPTFKDPLAYIQQSYEQNIFDEFIVPAAHEQYDGIHKNDGLIMTNFRTDRARQILKALLLPDFQEFPRGQWDQISYGLGMTPYSEELNPYMGCMFPPEPITQTLGEILGAQGLHQLRIAETEKYAHVTFFFNGGIETPNYLEERILVPSPHVPTFDEKPEMAAPEITQQLVEKLHHFDVVVVNYANADMVGHTGNLPATVKAIECLDTCLGHLEKAVTDLGGYLLVTADHGNAEEMVDEIHHQPHTAHSTNLVPFVVVSHPSVPKITLRLGGSLKDVAPTLLDLMGIPKPLVMTGTSLLCASH